jgi:hypothetical protein
MKALLLTVIFSFSTWSMAMANTEPGNQQDDTGRPTIIREVR